MTPASPSSPRNEGDSWSEALRDAGRRLAAGPRAAHLFLERTVDAALTAGAGALVPEIGLRRGLRVEPRRGPARFVAHPSRGELSRLALDPDARPVTTPASGPPPVPEAFRARVDARRHELSRLVGRLEEARPPGTVVRAGWAAFEQHVDGWHENPWSDRRRTERLRVELFADDGRCLARREATSPERWDAAADAALRRARVVVGEGWDVSSPDTQNVWLAPGVGGVVVHELIGHALEGEAAGRGWLAGHPKLSPELSVRDDPTRGRCPWAVDDEGVAAAPVDLVREGTIVGALDDRDGARRRGSTPSGHGRRSGFREPVLPRMGATFVECGPHEAASMVASIDRGVRIRRIDGASVDVERGVAAFRVTEADRVERGRIVAPLAPFVWRVEGRTLLTRALHVGDDLTFDALVGTCHSHGQPLATTVGAPTMWIG